MNKPAIQYHEKAWQALLLDGGRTVWACDHQHPQWEDAVTCADKQRHVVPVAPKEPVA